MTEAANSTIWTGTRTNSRIAWNHPSTRPSGRNSAGNWTNGNGSIPIVSDAFRIYSPNEAGLPFTSGSGTVPRLTSLLIKPVSAVCNLDCTYCFYLDREADPYESLPGRRMSDETLERL